jgi:hypothetical protein
MDLRDALWALLRDGFAGEMTNDETSLDGEKTGL